MDWTPSRLPRFSSAAREAGTAPSPAAPCGRLRLTSGIYPAECAENMCSPPETAALSHVRIMCMRDHGGTCLAAFILQ